MALTDKQRKDIMQLYNKWAAASRATRTAEYYFYKAEGELKACRADEADALNRYHAQIDMIVHEA